MRAPKDSRVERKHRPVIVATMRHPSVGPSCPFAAALHKETVAPPQADDQTVSSRNEKERPLQRKMLLFSVTLLAYQLVSSSHLDYAAAQAQSGIASVYSTDSGSGTASGQKLNPGALTAAHRTLPFGTKVRVTNKKNGRSVVVTINDRGPFVRGRVIDLTPAGARALGFAGLAQVVLRPGG
jgi:rare lipoprotein A